MSAARSPLFQAVVLFVLAFAAQAARANTVVCVTSAQDLINQLHLAADPELDAPYVIHVQEGTYNFTVPLDTEYPPNILRQPTYIQGGFRGPNCSGGRDIDYRQTVFDLGKHAVSLRQFNPDLSSNRLQLDDLTLKNATSVSLDAGAWDAACNLCSDTPGKIVLQDVHVTGITGQLSLYPVKSSAVLTNVLLDHLGAPADACQVKFNIFNDLAIYMNHVSADLSAGRNFCIDAGYDGAFQVNLSNSIVWSSDGSSGKLKASHSNESTDPINLQLNHSIYRIDSSGFGAVSTTELGNFNPVVDPQWNNPAGGDYGLKVSSPAVDSGTTAVTGGEPSTDAIGNPRRTAGSPPDRGALESPWTTVDLFDVTNTNDSGPGSLRAAITNANNSNAAHATIRFAIPDPANPQQGLCPAVINVAAQLPDIGHAQAQSLLIDGYTQSPARWNAEPETFDGALCVALIGAGANFALRVPAQTPDPANGGALAPNQVSLYLSGLGIGDFRQGVMLLGGRDHTVVGNQFGGVMPTATGQLQLYGFDYAALNVDIVGDSGTLRVGGNDLRDRNVFLNATSFGALPSATAIMIGTHIISDPAHCQVIGNNVGVPDDGMQVPPTVDYGMQLDSTGCYVAGNRFAGMKRDAIYVNGGSYNVIQNNTLGLFPYGFDLSSVNSGAGIRLNGSHNVVGQQADTGGAASDYANLIEFMDQGGIVGMSGSGNALRGNALLYNGAADADLNIDLGTDGPTQNDSGDSDSGPNNRQNFPIVHSVVGAAAPATKNVALTLGGRLGSTPGPGFYQIDVYYDEDGCTAGGRGSARSWIGGENFVYIPVGASAASWSTIVKVPTYYNYGAVSVTATNNSNGDYSTSELGECFPLDTLFRDGFND